MYKSSLSIELPIPPVEHLTHLANAIARLPRGGSLAGRRRDCFIASKSTSTNPIHVAEEGMSCAPKSRDSHCGSMMGLGYGLFGAKAKPGSDRLSCGVHDRGRIGDRDALDYSTSNDLAFPTDARPENGPTILYVRTPVSRPPSSAPLVIRSGRSSARG